MMATAFLIFVAVMAFFVAAMVIRHLRTTAAVTIIVVMVLWLTYAGLLGYFGVIGNPVLPGPAFLLIPVFLFVFLFLTRSEPAARIATTIPLGLLIGAQVFRVGVELVLHQLWLVGLAPRMLTYSGANYDIVIGISAPLVAWLYVRGNIGERAALAWNALGIVLLVNIATRALLTAPGPLHVLASEVPNRAIGTFPFSYIPGFLAPLALVLHVLAIRALRARLRGRQPVPAIG